MLTSALISSLLLAPDLSLTTANGKTETLFPARDRKATVVFLVLAECPIARGYSPEMGRIAKAYSRQGVRFLMAFADEDASKATMASHLKSFALPFSGAKYTPELIRFIKPTAVPTAAIISPTGKLVYAGRIDDRYPSLGAQRKPRSADLRHALNQFLSGRPVTPARTPVIGCTLPDAVLK